MADRRLLHLGNSVLDVSGWSEQDLQALCAELEDALNAIDDWIRADRKEGLTPGETRQ